MSSQREVFIRILALLQRTTLIQTKSRTLKYLKRHYSTARSMKTVAVLMEDGAFALFFRPHPGAFDSSRVPSPGNLPSKAKKILMPGGLIPEVELTDALISSVFTQYYRTTIRSFKGTYNYHEVKSQPILNAVVTLGIIRFGARLSLFTKTLIVVV